MDLALTLLVAVGLSMDALAVAVACSASKSHRKEDGLRLALSFGFFQFAMAAAGWLAGATFRSFFADIDHWVAFGILLYIGGRMVLSGLFGRGEKDCTLALTPKRLLALSVATSIDAFVVGMGFAFIDAELLLNAAVIGIVTFAITLAGSELSARAKGKFGSKTEIFGGLVLIGIGIKILLDHML